MPFLLKPPPKHLHDVTPCVCFTATLTLVPQAVKLQQTLFFITTISQIFFTPVKFLYPHIAC